MIGYITIGVQDMGKGKSYWQQLLEPLGCSMVMEMDRIAFIGKARGQPMLAVCIPYDKQAPSPGNGPMLAFPVDSREEVDKQHARALELGGTDEGPPGERMPTFYGGYFRDPDGNKAVFYKMG